MLLILFLSCIQAANIQYLYKVTTGVFRQYHDHEWTRTDAKELSPYVIIQTPFTISFFGDYRRIILHQDGAIFFNPMPNCCQVRSSDVYCIFETPDCNLNNAYDNVIGGLFTDFENVPESMMLYQLSTASLVVMYQDMQLSNGLSGISFSIEIDANGRIIVQYYVIVLPSNGALIGIRGPENAEPYDYNKESWGFTINGTYPPKESIQSNQTVEYCPLSVNFCMSPTSGTGNETLYLFADRLECLSLYEHHFYCFFTEPGVPSLLPNNVNSSFLSPVTYDQQLNAATCTIPENNGQSRVQVQLVHAESWKVIYMDKPLIYSYRINAQPFSDLQSLTLCNDCGRFLIPTNQCWTDCTGTWFGSAILDDCRVCSGGTSNHSANSDKNCKGECFGGNISGANNSVNCSCALLQLNDSKILLLRPDCRVENIEDISLTLLPRTYYQEFLGAFVCLSFIVAIIRVVYVNAQNFLNPSTGTSDDSNAPSSQRRGLNTRHGSVSETKNISSLIASPSVSIPVRTSRSGTNGRYEVSSQPQPQSQQPQPQSQQPQPQSQQQQQHRQSSPPSNSQLRRISGGTTTTTTATTATTTTGSSYPSRSKAFMSASDYDEDCGDDDDDDDLERGQAGSRKKSSSACSTTQFLDVPQTRGTPPPTKNNIRRTPPPPSLSLVNIGRGTPPINIAQQRGITTHRTSSPSSARGTHRNSNSNKGNNNKNSPTKPKLRRTRSRSDDHLDLDRNHFRTSSRASPVHSSILSSTAQGGGSRSISTSNPIRQISFSSKSTNSVSSERENKKQQRKNSRGANNKRGTQRSSRTRTKYSPRTVYTWEPASEQ